MNGLGRRREELRFAICGNTRPICTPSRRRSASSRRPRARRRNAQFLACADESADSRAP